MRQQVAQTHRRTARTNEFPLVSDEPEKILPTILSRTQQIEVKGIDHESLVEALPQKPSHGGRGSLARNARGSYTAALKSLDASRDNLLFFDSVRHADAVKLPTQNQGHAEMERTDCRHGTEGKRTS